MIVSNELNFVTLFDKNYFSRGLMLYNSLVDKCRYRFTLFILVLDEEILNYFNDNVYENIVVISLQDVMDKYPQLEKIKEERTRGEFCWTLSSFSIQYAIQNYSLSGCIYVDSDVYFYNDPNLIIERSNNCSVIITEHNYSPEYDQSKKSGKFCVQFMLFKNDKYGQEVLEWWRSRCEEWCFNRCEDGKFGDQKYLDDWESRFFGAIYNCKDVGCCLAPWNCQKFELLEENSRIYVRELITGLKGPLVFFHFHGLLKLDVDEWLMSGYKLDNDIKELYRNYILKISEIEKSLPESLVSRPMTNPYVVKNKFKRALRTAWKSFCKEFFDKPQYIENIIKVKD